MFILSLITTLTNSPANCGLFQNILTWIFCNLFTFILPFSQFFGVCCSHFIFIFTVQYTIHLANENTGYLILLPFTNFLGIGYIVLLSTWGNLY